jgi:hypothetical protein
MEHYRRYGSCFGIYDVNSRRRFDRSRSADFVKRVAEAVTPSDSANVPKRTPGAARNAYKKYLRSTELHIGRKHTDLQERFKSFLRRNSATDLEDHIDSVDLRYRDRTGSVTFCEVKPCTYQTTRFAIRTAIGQLLDYRQAAKANIPKLMVVLEQRPTNFEIELATGNGFCIAYPAGAGFHSGAAPAGHGLAHPLFYKAANAKSKRDIEDCPARAFKFDRAGSAMS